MQAPQKSENTFPRFHDGDVEIRFSALADDVYSLHSFILSLYSPFFKASLSQRWAGSDQTPSTGKHPRRNYELRFKAGQADGILIKTV